jgi:hypothetical protein
MSYREPEAWGGELRMPSALRRLLHRPAPAGDSDEAVHEKRHPAQDLTTPLENVDRAVLGAWSEGHPGHQRNPHNQRPRGR